MSIVYVGLDLGSSKFQQVALNQIGFAGAELAIHSAHPIGPSREISLSISRDESHIPEWLLKQKTKRSIEGFVG